MDGFTVFFWLWCCTAVLVAEKNVSSKESKEKNLLSTVLQSFFKDPHDRFIRPNYLGKPVLVHVGVNVSSIGKINVQERTVRIDLSLTQSWVDHRHKHNLSSSIVPLVGTKPPSEYIWIPDTVIVNSKHAKKGGFRVHVDNLRIKEDGRITLITSLSVYAYCDLDFRHYPMDTQTCMFGFESYGYSIRHLKYKFAEKSHLTFDSTLIPQFQLSGFNTSTTSIGYDAGIFDVLMIHLEMKREVELMVMNTFFPSVAVVAVSWISLWIHKKSASARLGTGITTLLTLVWTWMKVNKQVPKVDYVKAIDIYFIVSFVFIFMTMFEYALVAYFNFPLMKMKRVVHEAKRTSGDGQLSTISSVSTLNSSCYERSSRLSLDTLTAHKRRQERSISQTNQFLNYMKESNETYPNGGESKRRDSNEKKPNFDNSELEESDCGSDDSSAEVQDVKTAHLYNPKTSSLDIISRVLFPFLYIAFLISFWTFHLRR